MPSASTARSTLAAAVAVLVGVGLLWSRRRPTGGARDALLSVPRLAPLVPQPWAASASADALARSTRPLRFYLSADRAGVPLQWDVVHLASRGGATVLPVLEQSRGTSGEFVLARGREADFERSRGVAHVNLTLEDFWSPSGSVLRYHSGPLASWPSALRAEVGADLEERFSVQDAPADVRRDRWPVTSANVWAAHAGVVATTHYDTAHNYVVQ
eukprot:6751070-Prymnesium_polylepis.1